MSDVLLRSRGRTRRRRRLVRIAVVLTVLLLLLGGSIVGLSWLPQMRITAATIEGANSLSTSTLESSVLKALSGTYGHVFPKNNVLLYSKEVIVQSLLAQYSPLKSASVKLEDFHTVRVTVTERTPVALWCGTEPDIVAPCYLLDDSGAAYAPSADYSGDVYLRYYGSLSTSTVPERYLGVRQFEELQALIRALGQSVSTDTPQTIAVDEHADVHVTFTSGFVLLFSLTEDEGLTRNRFTLALKSSPFKGHSLSEFQYLDLRFGDKLYYKVK